MNANTRVEYEITKAVSLMSKKDYKEFLLELKDLVDARLDAVNVELAEEAEK